MHLFKVLPGQRVWHNSTEREWDIFDVIEVRELYPRDLFNSAPWAYCYARRPGMGLGPHFKVGPGYSPIAGQP